jgi:xylan 1,4-beta-xylosidase
MKKIIFCFLVLFFSVVSFAQPKGKFYNPILAGFYPDPSLVKVGTDYYLVNSTFGYFPGIPIFHSKDLTTWNQIGHVLDRNEQLKLEGLGVTRGIFAPAIKYHNGIFYVTCTLVDGGGNFVVTAINPAGPWSNPIWLPEVNGIDPSIFFDDDKAYLIYNSDAPDNKPLYQGHRTIRMYEFDYKNLKVVGDNKILVNGGVDFSKKPIWIEGPHIYKKDGFYYLIPAEGGTAEDHSQVVFRSEKVDGPYVPGDKNPILTQRHLDPKRKNPVTCTGHAALVENDKGDWSAVFLACRPYEPFEENYYNTGRETFLAPVKWIDGWPVINPDYEEVQYSYPLPMPKNGKAKIPMNGNFTLKENFDSKILPFYWMFIRNPQTKWYSLTEKKGELKIEVRPETVSGTSNPSFIGRRQQHSIGYGSVAMSFIPKNENEKAGIIIFQIEESFYYLCKSKSGNDFVVQLFKSNKNKEANNMELIAKEVIDKKFADKELYLKIETNQSEFSFYYGFKKNEWRLLKDEVDATVLSIRKAWSFVGNVYAMYATSLGQPSTNCAYFDWFEYKGNDKIYQKK